MSNQILIKRGTSSPTPTLEYGELGYNSTEGTLYIGNSNRENVAIGGPGAFVKKSGDTMTGILTTKGLTIHNVDTDYPSLTFQAKDATNHSILIQPNLSDGVRQFAIYQYPSDSDDAETRYYEAYKLPTTPDGLTANGLYNILTTKNPVTVAQGGTGATTAAGARNNLSVPYYAKYDAGNLQTGAGNASAWITYYGDDGTTYNQMDLTKTATQFSKPVNIASGGTGANTPKGAEYNINGSIAESTETIGDAHRLVFSRTTPTATNGVFIYKQASILWNYIKGKTDDQYLKLSGGTLTGNLTVNSTSSSGFVALKEDGEGGTIQVGSKNGTYTYEIDAYNDSTIRLHQAPKHPDGITNKFLTWHGDTGQLDAVSLSLGTALSVGNGGTGATNADDACRNLGTFRNTTTSDAYYMNGGSGTHSAWVSYLENGSTLNQMDLWSTYTSFRQPVNIASGGTGATKAADARTNLGVPPTSHASTATTYGVASASNYGHAMASSTTPKALGTAAVGSETAKFARGDHVHALPALTSCTGTLTVAKGGTGATTITGARTNLGILPHTTSGCYADSVVNDSLYNLVFWSDSSKTTVYNQLVLEKDKTWFGQPVNVASGGTGATTARAAEYNICNGMAQVTSAMDDDTMIVIKRSSSASTTNGALCYRNASLLKSYLFVYSSSTPSSSHNVKGKIWLKPV